ncbi:acyl carrier protein [Nitratidesulfovibrio sp. SRB-5]|uniref:acyl carrier protein n=1 Tax=Nitratidesulfovibrio sp. SRB-5 TaxID=2872636 RepID=UPI001025ABBC|nr:acyl carrier protein [Nitratidesulfovibrio sp. SRB-5]MBZ2173483.1 acyl carrier protein [Nitratidesulfovibrio sp. SRB-5]RXF72144.1 acyl carrier protein [Desulfovibrio sp. DS-1]
MPSHIRHQPHDSHDIVAAIAALVAPIFDVDAATLSPATRLMADLPCESIDLLEIGAGLNRRFAIPVRDAAAFLTDLRIHVLEAERTGEAPAARLAREYPHLSAARVAEVLAAVRVPGAPPVLTIGDVAAYVAWSLTRNNG